MTHVHYWLLGEVEDGKVRGRCRRCRKRRVFPGVHDPGAKYNRRYGTKAVTK